MQPASFLWGRFYPPRFSCNCPFKSKYRLLKKTESANLSAAGEQHLVCKQIHYFTPPLPPHSQVQNIQLKGQCHEKNLKFQQIGQGAHP